MKASQELAACVRGAGGARTVSTRIGASDYPFAVRDCALAAAPEPAVVTAQRTLAIGVSARSDDPQGVRIALHAHRCALLAQGIVEAMRRRARGSRRALR